MLRAIRCQARGSEGISINALESGTGRLVDETDVDASSETLETARDDDDKDFEPWFVSMSHSTEDCTKQPVQCTADFRLSTWPPQRHFIELGIGWIHIDQLGTDSKHVTVTWNPQVSDPQHTRRSTAQRCHYPRRAPLLGTGLN